MDGDLETIGLVALAAPMLDEEPVTVDRSELETRGVAQTHARRTTVGRPDDVQ